jgi:hypothetical protein
MSGSQYPLWVQLSYAAFVLILIPVYWRHYGPGNFLWFSDIALFAVLISLWTGNRLLFSMMAVGVLPIEMLWLVDFVALGKTTGIVAYMFKDDSPLYLRALCICARYRCFTSSCRQSSSGCCGGRAMMSARSSPRRYSLGSCFRRLGS